MLLILLLPIVDADDDAIDDGAVIFLSDINFDAKVPGGGPPLAEFVTVAVGAFLIEFFNACIAFVYDIGLLALAGGPVVDAINLLLVELMLAVVLLLPLVDVNVSDEEDNGRPPLDVVTTRDVVDCVVKRFLGTDGLALLDWDTDFDVNTVVGDALVDVVADDEALELGVNADFILLPPLNEFVVVVPNEALLLLPLLLLLLDILPILTAAVFLCIIWWLSFKRSHIICSYKWMVGHEITRRLTQCIVKVHL